MIKAAAKMINEDIREMDLTKSCYPSVDDIKSSNGKDKFIPERSILLSVSLSHLC